MTDQHRIQEAARRAFATGWAIATAQHPVPLTERARISCAAAVRVAEASPQPTTVATLQLGQLEGVWALIYARREAVEQLHGAALADVMDALKDLAWEQILGRINSIVLVEPGISGKDLATRLAGDIEQLISYHLPADARAAWQTAMHAALIDGMAAGQTAGLALVGDATGLVIDFNLAGTAAKAALTNNQMLWDQASTWMSQQTHGLGYQISQKLASLWGDQASKQDMLDAISTILGSSNNAGLILDSAIGKALSAGAVDTYSRAGVDYVDFITAGDGRVCPVCGEAEDNNPYSLANAPLPGLHPSCRCALSPSDYQPTSAALQLLGPYVGGTDLEDEAA